MSVPLDRLYNFLNDVAQQQDILIYRFVPHGSTKWQDLMPLFLPSDHQSKNSIMTVCHDQDPVNLNYIPKTADFFKRVLLFNQSRFRHTIFVHSQKNLNHAKLEIFDAVPVYYWSHALIAKDWYRYAKIDPMIAPVYQTKPQPFLIYSRAWSGSREYRLKFLYELIKNNLHPLCNAKFAQYDNDQHYSQHFFKNKDFKCDCKFEEFFEPNTATSAASADYCVKDYANSNIEIVLETVFDQHYIHLTEKTLRPISVGKIFLLASMPNSLAYLREYGFQTFSPWIDETYDQIQDHAIRLSAIVKEMKRIANLPVNKQQEIFWHCQNVADFNRQYFFSDEFSQKIVKEFCDNLSAAVHTIKSSTLYNSPVP